MRLISLHVLNYRVHVDCQLEFDRARTLVGGPNEAGKSTLAEAIHRALFLRHSVGGALHESMRSFHGGGMPEVTLRFEVGERCYTLYKRFAGARGSGARLAEDGGRQWLDDEAETHLAALLEVSEATGGRAAAGQLQGQWAHLLAWQGESPRDPLQASGGQHSRLLQRLQDSQGAVVQQSPLDEHVAGEVARLLGDHRTERGPRAGGPLQAALNIANERRADLDRAQTALSALARVREEYDGATKALKAAEEALSRLEPQRKALEQRHAEVERLQKAEQEAVRIANEHDEKLMALEEVEQTIARRRETIRDLREKLAPLARQAMTCRAELRGAEDARSRAVQELSRASEALDLCWARDALAQASLDGLNAAQRVSDLERNRQALQQHRRKVEDLKQRLAALAPVTGRHVGDLDKHSLALNEAQAALAAMAAGVEVLESPGPVRVGIVDVAAGQSRIVTEATDIVAPGGVRLRIQPGGGDALAEARRCVQESEVQLRELLRELGLPSREEAIRVAAERERLEAQRGQLEETGPGVDIEPEELEAQLAREREAVIQAQATVERRVGALRDDERVPSDRSQVEEWRRECKSQLEAAKGLERDARNRQEQIDETANKLRSKKEQAEVDQRAAERELENEAVVLEEKLREKGDDAERAKRLAQAVARAEEAKSRRDSLRAELSAQRPDTLSSESDRFVRAEKVEQDRRVDATERRLRSEGALKREGLQDLASIADLARADLEKAEADLVRVQRRVAALELLGRAFEEHRQQVVARYTQPLADEVRRYARCVFGAHAVPGLAWDETAGAFASLNLSRGVAHAFDSLSMGAREQLGVAVRLAIAKVLAAGFGGSLPVVLDDAFSHSDGDRVERLLEMLDLAATDGLQVILLTCKPDDYTALGARRVDLPAPISAPLRSSAATSAAHPDSGMRLPIAPTSELGDETQAAPFDAQDDEDALLAAVCAAGGSAGNLSLRTSLGWDEARYGVARKALVASGRAVVGAGRGGSLKVVT